MFEHPRGSLRNWIAGLDPRRQTVYGCLGVVLAGMFALYCAGSLSLLVRPFLFQWSPAALEIPTLALATGIPTPTSLPAIITLPNRPVPNTPTQGPIPTREAPTITATPDPFTTPSVTGTLGTPRASITATKASATPTRR